MSENEVIEETVSAPKSVKNVEAGSPFDLFKPKPETTKQAKDETPEEQKPANIFDVFKPKDDDEKKDEEKPVTPKKKEDKKDDVKPLFPSNDPFNLKKTIEDAQQAMKEKGLGGLISSVQKNVEATVKALTSGGEGKTIIEGLVEWFKNLLKTVQEQGVPAVLSQFLEKLKETLAKGIIENNKWPVKALTQN